MTRSVPRTSSVVVAPDGTRLAVHRVDGPGDPVLVVPGGPGRASTYLEDLGGLAQDRALALLDTRGSGRSEVPADPDTMRAPALAEDVEVVRASLGVDPVVVLGHSAGCLTTLLWAAAHSRSVAALVLVGPPPYPAMGLDGADDREEVRAARADEPWYAEASEALAALQAGGASPAEERLLNRAARPFYYGRWTEREQAHAHAADHEVSRRPSEAFLQGLDPAALRDRLRGLDAVRAPVLVLAGDRDGVTGTAPVAALAADLPRARTVLLPGAGHFPWVDEPDAFRTAVAGFLADV